MHLCCDFAFQIIVKLDWWVLKSTGALHSHWQRGWSGYFYIFLHYCDPIIVKCCHNMLFTKHLTWYLVLSSISLPLLSQRYWFMLLLLFILLLHYFTLLWSYYCYMLSYYVIYQKSNLISSIVFHFFSKFILEALVYVILFMDAFIYFYIIVILLLANAFQRYLFMFSCHFYAPGSNDRGILCLASLSFCPKTLTLVKVFW